MTAIYVLHGLPENKRQAILTCCAHYRAARGDDFIPSGIHETPSGKPYLDGGPCFSVSHSGEYWLCAVSERELGIDIERVTARRTRLIAERMFPLPDALYARRDETSFFRVWCAREAYAKYTGLGLSATRGLHPVSDGDALAERVDGAPLRFIDIAQGYVTCLCGGGRLVGLVAYPP